MEELLWHSEPSVSDVSPAGLHRGPLTLLPGASLFISNYGDFVSSIPVGTLAIPHSLSCRGGKWSLPVLPASPGQEK